MLVFGGSLGARSINLAAVEAFRDAPVPRAARRAASATTTSSRARLGDPPPAHYDLRPFLRPFGPALAASDLVVARAGGSIFEVCAHGRPALLVPYPHATADHQAANARWMADGGAAVIVADDELTAERLRPRGRRAAARPDAAGGDGPRVGRAGPAAGRGRRRRAAAAGGGGVLGCPA